MRIFGCRRFLLNKAHYAVYVIIVGCILGMVAYHGRLSVGRPVLAVGKPVVHGGIEYVDPVLNSVHLSKQNMELVNQKASSREKHYNNTWIPREIVDAKLLPRKVIDGVKYFVFFVGHGRGGSSILGSLVDAHPHMVVATDYQLFHKWNENPEYHRNRSVLYTALYIRAKRVAIGYKKYESRGYSLYIENAYMGRYLNNVTVIGEKEAGSATASFSINQARWLKTYQDIKRTTKVPVKIVQVRYT